MASNKDLNLAAALQDDEFYTRLYDIAAEVSHYKHHFKDKTVLCNCDDPRQSNFFHYFAENFEALGLKRLIATCYKSQDVDLFTTYEAEQAVYIIYDGDVNGNKHVDLDELQVLPLKGDGDFRSPECVELLKQADIVCTNPPYSLWREFFTMLMEHKKQFLILGNTAALHYSEVLPFIRDGLVWVGYKPYSRDMLFEVTPEHEAVLRVKKKEGSGWRIVNGQFLARNPSLWYTNMDIPKRHEDFVSLLFKKYNPAEYPTYANFDAIDVKNVADIPCDYYGMMGVPDSFVDHFNPDQFELIGLGHGNLGRSIGVGPIRPEHKAMMRSHTGPGDVYFLLPDGTPKEPYSRLIIRRK